MATQQPLMGVIWLGWNHRVSWALESSAASPLTASEGETALPASSPLHFQQVVPRCIPSQSAEVTSGQTWRGGGEGFVLMFHTANMCIDLFL